MDLSFVNLKELPSKIILSCGKKAIQKELN